VIEEQADREQLAAATGSTAAPLFLYLAYTDPHAGGLFHTTKINKPQQLMLLVWRCV
jgi:hypothetical protein